MRTSVTRRSFLQTISAFAALGSPSLAAAAGKGMFVTMRTQNGYWKPGTPAGTGGVVPVADWEGLARGAARLGYGGVDLPLAPAMQAGADKVRAVLSELKLKTGFLGSRVSPFTADETAFQTSLKTFDDICLFARTIGCPRLMLFMMPSTNMTKEEWRKITLDRAKAMSESMDKHRVTMAIEFVGPMHFRKQLRNEFIYKMPETVEFCKEAGANWGVTLDSWHWYHAGGTYEDIVAAGKSRITVVHISDSKPLPAEQVRDSERILPGEGIIPLDRFFEGLKKIGYEGHVSPEPLGRFGAEVTADEAAKITLATTISVMKKAKVKMTA